MPPYTTVDMLPIKLVAIIQSIAIEIQVISVRRAGDGWAADSEATVDGIRQVVTGEGSTAEHAQVRAMALAVRKVLPKRLLEELLALGGESE
jgi:hypothetical protein